jgi:hypothetical protein
MVDIRFVVMCRLVIIIEGCSVLGTYVTESCLRGFFRTFFKDFAARSELCSLHIIRVL